MDQVVDRLYIALNLDSTKVEQGLQTVEGALTNFIRAVVTEISKVGGPQLTEPFNTAVNSAATTVTEAEGLMADGAVAASESISAAEQKVAEGAQAVGDAVNQATQQIENGAEKADKTLGWLEQKIAGGLKDIMTNFVAPIAGIFAAGKLFGDYVSEADALGEFADTAGVDVEKLQAYGEAVKRNGSSMEAFKGTISRLSTGMAQMATTGGGRMKPFFDELGIAVTDSSGKMRDVFDVIDDISDKFSEMDSQKALGLGRKFGMDQGQILAYQAGSKELKNQVKEMMELGVYSKRDTDIAGKFGDAIDALKQSFKMFAAITMRVVTPAVTWIAEKMEKFITFLRRNEPFVKVALITIASAITASLVPAIAKFSKAWATAGKKALLNPMTWLFLAIGIAIAAVILLVDDLMTHLRGGNSALGPFWDGLIKILEKVENLLKSIRDFFFDPEEVEKMTKEIQEQHKNGTYGANAPAYAGAAGGRPVMSGNIPGYAAGSSFTTGGVPNYGPPAGRNVDIKSESNIGDVYVYTDSSDPKGVGNAVQVGVSDAARRSMERMTQVAESGVNP